MLGSTFRHSGNRQVLRLGPGLLIYVGVSVHYTTSCAGTCRQPPNQVTVLLSPGATLANAGVLFIDAENTALTKPSSSPHKT